MTTNHEHWPQLVTSSMKLKNFIKHSIGGLLDYTGLRVISQASKSSILGKRKQTQSPGSQDVHSLPRVSNSLTSNSGPQGKGLAEWDPRSLVARLYHSDEGEHSQKASVKS